MQVKAIQRESSSFSNGLNGSRGSARDLAADTSSTDPSSVPVPPFPADVPTAPLLCLSLSKLKARDAPEVARFSQACKDLGFFYLELTGCEDGENLLANAGQLFTLGEELFNLPVAEKKKYDFMHLNSYFGYKGYGANVVDRQGNLDRNEFYNVRQSLILVYDRDFQSQHQDASLNFQLCSRILRYQKTTSSKSRAAKDGQPRSA